MTLMGFEPTEALIVITVFYDEHHLKKKKGFHPCDLDIVDQNPDPEHNDSLHINFISSLGLRSL